jgi:hypothetical protein
MRLPRRRTLWLSAVLLLATVVGASLFVPRSRITQANLDRIHNGMTEQEIKAIVGEPGPTDAYDELRLAWIAFGADESRCTWRNGPNWIDVDFREGRAYQKDGHFATAWETVTWYAKKGAAKIGVKWD